MSGGKKKSGFQITSVTSDYEQQREGPPGGGGGGGSGEAEDAEAAAAAAPRNGPAAPGSPGPAPAAPGPGGGSRFRVVKLDQGAGEPYRRGRWTCRDFYEQEADPQRAARLAEAARHPQSLDSRLEAAGLRAKPPGPFSPRAPRRGPAPQAQLVLPPSPGAAAGHQARSLGAGLPLLLRPQRTPPSPGAPARPPPPGEGAPDSGERTPPGAIPTLLVEEHLLPRNVTQLIQRETEEQRSKVLPRESRSRSSSPGPPLFRDASPSRRTSDPFGAARFSLARSMFGMGAAHDIDDDSGTNSSMIAIDNKIEQAMDLVKSHLMFAVREEVEVLREQIKDLSERNALLEQENTLLRSLASSEQLTRFQAQLQAAKPSPSGTA